jgi:hypothetical protein
MSLSARQGDGSDIVVSPPLSQAAGYIVIIGVGLVVAFGMIQLLLLCHFWKVDAVAYVSPAPRYDLRHEAAEINRRRGQFQN